MNHHAYLIEGADAILRAKEHAGSSGEFIRLSFETLSVEDARLCGEIVARQAALGGTHIFIEAERILPPAQNALLKTFEETTAGVTLYLAVPRASQLLPTLRSRLLRLPGAPGVQAIDPAGAAFLAGTLEGRRKTIKKLVDAKDRLGAARLLGGVQAALRGNGVTLANARVLATVTRFRGYLEGGSANIRMLLEHLALTLPKGK